MKIDISAMWQQILEEKYYSKPKFERPALQLSLEPQNLSKKEKNIEEKDEKDPRGFEIIDFTI